MPARILEVPLLEPDSFLTIDVGSDLPEDPTEVCQLLADEKCAPKWWLAIASAYTQKSALDSAIEVISTGLEKSPVLKTDSDRAPFYTMLSWLYLQKMRQAKTVDKKEYFDKASEYANTGFSASKSLAGTPDSSITALLAQGTLVSAVGNFNDALQPFQTVLAQQPQNIFAKLGRARVLYFRKNYRGALKLYQEVLKQAPELTGVANPRIGIGLCFWQLNDRLKARLAWERVLKTAAAKANDESSSNSSTAAPVAHACLGLWFMDAALHGHREEFQPNYVQSMTHFQKAYQGGLTSLPGLKIASYLFSKHDMVKVSKLTDKVLESSTLPELLGEALFWKARAAHYAGDLDTALTLYTQATSADPGNVAAAIGKGVVEITQDRASEALLTFELVVQSHPRSADALFYTGLFGALKGHGENTSLKARDMLEKYVIQTKAAHEDTRPEALVALSQLWEKADPRKAYDYLLQASSLLKVTPLPFIINLGSLAFSLRNFDEAETLFTKAADFKPTQGEDETEIAKYKQVIAFNLARVQEELGKFEEAKKTYQSLGSLDARARLALIDREPTEELRNSVKQLLDVNSSNLEVRALYAWTLRYLVTNGSRDMAKQAADLEQEFHKQTLTTVDKHDAYSLVAMGNIYLSNAQTYSKSDLARRQHAYMRAGEFFEKALQLDRHNAYAAQGVAIALAETKRAGLALPVFVRVRETLGSDAVAFVNNAHCLMDVGDYTRATDMYNQAYLKGDATDAQLLSLLGRAWFARGSRAKDPEALATAVDWALKAHEASTDSVASKFNLLYVRLQLADVLRRRNPEQRSLQQLEVALDGVKQSIDVLKALIEDKDNGLPFSESDLEERLDLAEATLLPQLESAIDSQRTHERKAEEKRLEAQRKREETIKLQREAQEKLQRERAEREANLAEQRSKLQAQAAEWEAERAAEREQQQAAGGEDDKKRRKKAKNTDDLIDDSELPNVSDSESDREDRRKKSSKSRKRRQRSVQDDSDSDSGNEGTVTRKVNVMDDDEDVEDDAGDNAKEDDEGNKDELDDLF